jgi:hypothetical protein
MNIIQLTDAITAFVVEQAATIATLTAERDLARQQLADLQAAIDTAQNTVTPPPPPEYLPPELVNSANPSDLSNWQHRGAFANVGASLDVQRWDATSQGWVGIGTGSNTGDSCQIRSVFNEHASEWVGFTA